MSEDTTPLDVSARLTSKGRVTIPKPVRDALALHEGDTVTFRVERDRAIVEKTLDFLALAGSVVPPPSTRGMPWGEIRRQAWRARGAQLRLTVLADFHDRAGTVERIAP
jgi:AbrB family looped-hinge helix DNA binding protein